MDWSGLLNCLTEKAYLADREGYLVAANEPWLDSIGMREDDILGRHIRDVMWDHAFSLHCQGEEYLDDVQEDRRRLIVDEVLETGKTADVCAAGEAGHTLAYPMFEGGQLTRVLVIETLPAEKSSGAVSGREGPTHTIIGDSPPMRKVLRLIREVAAIDTTVMIIGETGVGKEVVAADIQRRSARSGKPFIRINCASIPENLLESELFGYESGAFTGAAKKGKMGLFELANRGTVLLDEIGEMPLSMQPKLLRAIQEREIFRVGGSAPIPIDVRIISSTNRDLMEMVERKEFREDLYYRLNIIPLRLPPLRDRGEDVILLAEAFIRRYNAQHGRQKYFSKGALGELCSYPWPGNIRELRNLVERLVVLSDAPKISAADLRHFLRPQFHGGERQEEPLSLKAATERFEKGLIEAALHQYGSTYKAAAALGTSQSTLVRKAHQFGINGR